jgi:hypothetical protein
VDKSQGTLCLNRARKVKEFVPLKYRKAIDEVVERNRTELIHELEIFGSNSSMEFTKAADC